MKFFKKFLVLIALATTLFARAIWAAELPPTVQWQKGFGGTADEWFQAVQQTSDGGFIIGGSSVSGVSGNKTSVNHGSDDYWVIKLDSNGNKVWENSFGGRGQDIFWSIQQTSEGGYILGGSSGSDISGNKTSTNYGGRDYWVVKLDSNGDKIWERSFGSSSDDELHIVQQTSDGGYLLGGEAFSGISGNKTNAGFGNTDFWLVKLNDEGNKIWEKSFGGNSGDSLYAIQQTTDGGSILGGWSYSGVSGNKTSGNYGAIDYWVVKLDANGEIVWDQSFGGNSAEYLWAVQQTGDGGYLLGGSSQSYPSGNKTSPQFAGQFGPAPDYWVVKLDANGNKLWDKSFGGELNDSLFSIQPTSGGYLLSGFSASGVSGNKTSPNLGAFNSFDYWILKLDESGNKVWEKSYGGNDSDTLFSLQPTSSGFILGGSSASGISGNKTNANYGGYDFWIVKLEGPPSIVMQPQSRSVAGGDPVSFSVVANGASPLTYRWFLNSASIANATNSSLTISNSQASDAGNYTVVVTNPFGSITSQVAVMIVLVQPTILAQPQSQIVAVGTNVTISVIASGAPPPSFQWQFNGSALAGATASNLTMVNIQPSQAGDYSVTVSNIAGSATSAVAKLTVINDAGRIVRVANTNSIAGGNVDVPIYLLAQGNESALGGSLVFDTSILAYLGIRAGSGADGSALNVNTNQLVSGRLGFTLSLGAGVSFGAGIHEVVVVSLIVMEGTGDITTPVAFGDQPIVREVSDSQARRLAATFTDGSVVVGAGGGYEADVTPLPSGNNAVTATDWVKVGRYVAGLDALTNTTQFQRADCAPHSTLGDGVLTVSDWVQAGRYAAALDPLSLTGGPASESQGGALHQVRVKAAGAPPEGGNRAVRVVDNMIQPGNTNVVIVQLLAAGNESALDFSLSFDSLALTYAEAALGADVPGGILNVNTNQLGTGQFGLALAMPIGMSLAAGTQELVRLTFVASMTATGSTTIAFADQPVFREVSDAFANALPTDYVNGVLTVVPKVLRLELIRHQSDGGFRLLIGNADGSRVESQRAAKVDVLATTNFALRETTWIKLTNPLVWNNGVLLLDDAESNASSRRFYQTLERP